MRRWLASRWAHAFPRRNGERPRYIIAAPQAREASAHFDPWRLQGVAAAERTKAQLGEAVISLLAEMPPEHVTAEMITERAGMGRATWFRHFSSKSDAATCALVARWMRWAADEAPVLGPHADLLPFLRMVYSQRETITLLYARSMRQAVLDASAKIAKALVVGGRTGYREKFYLYGFVGIHDEWVERGFAETPEEVAAMLSGFDDLISHMPL